jgi:hypothetical protein
MGTCKTGSPDFQHGKSPLRALCRRPEGSDTPFRATASALTLPVLSAKVCTEPDVSVGKGRLDLLMPLSPIPPLAAGSFVGTESARPWFTEDATHDRSTALRLPTRPKLGRGQYRHRVQYRTDPHVLRLYFEGHSSYKHRTTVMDIDSSILAPFLRSNASTEITERPADIERSERNIRLWKSYLPPDCVNTMIRMGWDKTT